MKRILLLLALNAVVLVLLAGRAHAQSNPWIGASSEQGNDPGEVTSVQNLTAVPATGETRAHFPENRSPMINNVLLGDQTDTVSPSGQRNDQPKAGSLRPQGLDAILVLRLSAAVASSPVLVSKRHEPHVWNLPPAPFAHQAGALGFELCNFRPKHADPFGVTAVMTYAASLR